MLVFSFISLPIRIWQKASVKHWKKKPPTSVIAAGLDVFIILGEEGGPELFHQIIDDFESKSDPFLETYQKNVLRVGGAALDERANEYFKTFAKTSTSF